VELRLHVIQHVWEAHLGIVARRSGIVEGTRVIVGLDAKLDLGLAVLVATAPLQHLQRLQQHHQHPTQRPQEP